MKYTENNINSIKTSDCTGCYACSFICPQNAISIEEKKGFRIATVHYDKCINCGLCLKVCHRNNDENNSIENSTAWECYSNDEKVLATSTSGGAAYELSKYFLKNGYKIIGCKYNYQNDHAEHDIIDSETQLYLFTGSKYIQSSLETFAGRISENGHYVFIGTPCQCYGLRKYLEIKKVGADFIFIDFFCHGFIPSDFFNYFLKKNKKDNLQKIEFRSKERGWHSFLCKLAYKDNYALIPYQESEFGIVFLNDFLLPNTCYNCKFRYNQISSDIRVGDYWGEKHKNNTKGVSCVLGVTEKGKNFLNDFFSKDLMYNNKIDLQEIKNVKCGNNKGVKSIPHFNFFFKSIYKAFGTKTCLVFIKAYLLLRGRR
jgi:coenzyme F420-reducing hydrogenase beta subunit